MNADRVCRCQLNASKIEGQKCPTKEQVYKDRLMGIRFDVELLLHSIIGVDIVVAELPKKNLCSPRVPSIPKAFIEGPVSLFWLFWRAIIGL